MGVKMPVLTLPRKTVKLEDTDDYQDGVRDAKHALTQDPHVEKKTFDGIFDGLYRKRYVAGFNSVIDNTSRGVF